MENCDTTNNDLLYAKRASTSIYSLKNETLNCKVKKNASNQSVNTLRENLDERNFGHITKQSLKDTSESVRSDLNNDRFSLHDCAFVLKGPMGFDSSTSLSLQEINATSVLDQESSHDVATTTSNCNLSGKLTRQLSEPPDMYSIHNAVRCDHLVTINDGELIRQNSEPTLSFVAKSDVKEVFPPSRTRTSSVKASEIDSNIERTENTCAHLSPIVKNKFRNLHAVHTSTPSNLLRRSLVTNDYILTPIANNDDKSMSPITQSATKMTKAMQV